MEQIDENVADVINESKDDFYDEYYYLKPDSEKSGWEKFCDGCKSFANWCKDNWEYICAAVVAVIVVVAIVVACVVTFGGAAVLLAAAVGAIVSFAGQLISDIITFVRTGEWNGSIQGYLGAILGGIAGGCVLLLTGGNAIIASSVEAAISTLFSESVDALRGSEKRPIWEILLDTTISAGISALFCKGFDKLSGKISKLFSSKIPALKRLTGRGSYGACFKGAITRLKRGSYKKFGVKSIRNGVVDGLFGGTVGTIFSGSGLSDWMSGGISSGIQWIFKRDTDIPSDGFLVKMPEIEPIPELDLLPLTFQLQ
ncbi:MAG: hypothetical protein PUC65_05325 [Clostridiales bacterium]|nr:hypothetical protein [Clostridiales bacterium]